MANTHKMKIAPDGEVTGFFDRDAPVGDDIVVTKAEPVSLPALSALEMEVVAELLAGGPARAARLVPSTLPRSGINTMLLRLETKGYIGSEWNRIDHTLYSLTTDGAAAYRAQLERVTPKPELSTSDDAEAIYFATDLAASVVEPKDGAS